MYKKLLALTMSCAMLFGTSAVVLAEEETSPPHEPTSTVTVPEITEAGVFVNEDEGSATGYTVTFVYESADAESVQLDMGANLYETGQRVGKVPENVYTPYEWQDGMIAVGYEGYIVDLEKAEGTDLWYVSIPLSHALYQYNYLVDGEWADDPTNPVAKNPNNENADGDSVVYVPLNAEKAPNSDDYSYLDTTTVTEAGTLTYVDYTDVNGDTAPLGVYTPYGYDAEREEPYKIVFVSHGAGASEVNWFGCGRLNTEYDHLIQDGLVEPTIVVTMNNTTYKWDYAVIIDNLMNHIIPYMEENYNIASDPSGRAFCGLSMGGMTTSNVLYNCADEFDYFGIFSGADGKLDYSQFTYEGELPSIMIGASCYDFGWSGDRVGTDDDGFTVLSTALDMGENGVQYGLELVNGGHDWYCWPQLMKIFATEYLWK